MGAVLLTALGLLASGCGVAVPGTGEVAAVADRAQQAADENAAARRGCVNNPALNLAPAAQIYMKRSEIAMRSLGTLITKQQKRAPKAKSRTALAAIYRQTEQATHRVIVSIDRKPPKNFPYAAAFRLLRAGYRVQEQGFREIRRAVLQQDAHLLATGKRHVKQSAKTLRKATKAIEKVAATC